MDYSYRKKHVKNSPCFYLGSGAETSAELKCGRFLCALLQKGQSYRIMQDLKAKVYKNSLTRNFSTQETLNHWSTSISKHFS